MIDWKKWIIYLCIAAAVILLITSCRTIRANREQRKDDNAVNRVTAKRDLLDKVGPEWAKFNPCIPVEPTITKGIVITKIDSSFGKQTIDELSHKIDSLLQVHCSTTKEYNMDSLRSAIANEVQRGCKPVIIYKTRVDTFRKPDVRALNIQVQANQDLQKKYDALVIKQANTENKSGQKTKLIIGLIAFIVVVIVLKILLK